MYHISYFALSGQDEQSKYCGILEINHDIFILDAGSGSEINNQYGISKIIPDISCLLHYKDRIKGIFLGTPKNLNIGALPFFIAKLGNIPIYTSEVGSLIIKTWFQQNSSTQFNKTNLKPNIQVVKPLTWFNVGNTKVCAFNIFNSLPDSLGYVFQTPLGAIVFVDEFMVGSSGRGYQSHLHELPELTKKNVLALIVGLQNTTDNLGYGVPFFNTYNIIKKTVAGSKQRMVIGCYDHDLLTIKNVIEITKTYGLKLGIYSLRMHKLILALAKMKYFNLFNISLFNFKEPIVYDANSVILVTGNYDRLFHNMYKIIGGQDSRLTLTKEDQYLLATVTKPGLEVKEAVLIDDISRLDINTKRINNTITLPVAGKEDQRFLANILKPRYIIPVYGFYKEYISYLDAVQGIVHDNNVKFLYNGEQIKFHHKTLPTIMQHKVGESYVNISGVLDLETTILLERQSLYNYGLIVVSFVYDKTKNVFSHPELFWKGLISSDHSKMTELNQLLFKSINNELLKGLGFAKHQEMNLKKLKQQLKKIILRTIERQLQKTPIVMLNIGLI